MVSRVIARLLTACCLGAIALVPLASTKASHASAAGFKWTTPIALPAPRYRQAVALGHDGNVYVFGGTDGVANDYNSTYVYHPRTNTWTVGTTLPMNVEGAAAVTLPDGRIVVMGGGTGCHNTQNCTIFNTVEAYNPASESWSTLAPMQSPRYRFGAALGSDGRVYAIGGWNGNTAIASVEAYSPISNTWTTVAPLPQAEEGFAATTTHGLILVLGGYNGSATYNNFFVDDGGQWFSAPAMPTPRNDLAVAVGPFGAIYAIGGYNTINGWLSIVEIFNGKTWSAGPPLPAALAGMGSVTLPTVNGPYIFTFGGYNGVASALVAAFGYFP